MVSRIAFLKHHCFECIIDFKIKITQWLNLLTNSLFDMWGTYRLDPIVQYQENVQNVQNI